MKLLISGLKAGNVNDTYTFYLPDVPNPVVKLRLEGNSMSGTVTINYYAFSNDTTDEAVTQTIEINNEDTSSIVSNCIEIPFVEKIEIVVNVTNAQKLVYRIYNGGGVNAS